MANIKISQLPSIGNSLSASTILPVVNTSGALTTDKVAVGNIANFTLTQAGNTLPPAFVANVAYSVTNAAQPNITSVGTLTALSINNVNSLNIPGGENGYVLQTNGDGVLSWVAQGGAGNGNPGGANTQIQYNDDGLFGGNEFFTYNKDTVTLAVPNLLSTTATIYGNLTSINAEISTNLIAENAFVNNFTVNNFTSTANIEAPYFIGNGSALTGITATAEGAGPVNSIQYNDSGIFAGDANLLWDSSNATLTTVTINASDISGNLNGNLVEASSVVANFLSGDGSNVSNVSAIYAGQANIANLANSVAVANVVGIGNIATVSLSGNSSQILYGNGVFDSIPNPFNQDLNTTDNVTFANITSTDAIRFSNSSNIVGALGYAPTYVSIEGYGSNAVNITANDTYTWTFDSVGNLTVPGNIISTVATGLTLGSNYDVYIVADRTDNNRTWKFDGAAGELILPNNGVIDPTDDNFEVRGIENVNFEANAVVNIYTDTSNNAYQWQFGDDSDLLTPGNIDFGNGSRAYITYGPNNYISLNNDGGIDLSCNTEVKITTNYGDTPNRAYSYFYANGTFSAAGNITTTGNANIGGNAITFGNIANGGVYVAPSSLVLQGGPSGGEGSQIIMGWANTNSITGQANSTWNIDVDSSNNFRIFSQQANSTTVNALSVSPSTGNITIVGNISGNTGGFALGYRDVPQVVASNTTLAATDGGKHYYSTTAANITLTIPNNATTSFATGTAISIVVQAAGNVLVNAASGVTLYMAGSSTSGNRAVGAYGMATLMKVASDTWFISGAGVY